MKRLAEQYLQEWKTRETRKPLLIRGARQVGKTYLVEHWGKTEFDNVVSINFERSPGLARSFSSCNPKSIIAELQLLLDTEIIPGNTLLFLDEIQAAAKVIPVLRYFYEELPQLHVIAAGSLLDFALQKLDEPMPVGRIEYFFLHPLSFTEFLEATGSAKLAYFIRSLTQAESITEPIHEQLLSRLREYYFVGGMPEAVGSFASSQDYREVQRIQSSIVLTMQDDFNKYRSRINPEILHLVLNHAAINPTRRQKFSDISKEFRAEQLRKGFELLQLARLVEPVYHSNANGVPLAAEKKKHLFKPLFLDIGLSNRLSGTSLVDSIDDLVTVREGLLAEQFVGQQLLMGQEDYAPPQLYYWERSNRGASAEIDFVTSYHDVVLPIEVKAGHGNTLRSLHWFMHSKKRTCGVRFSARMYESEHIIGTIQKETYEYALLSLPLYLAEEFYRVVPTLLQQTLTKRRC